MGQHIYGTVHQKQRKRWARKVRAGVVSCWRCGKPIGSTERWDLGHVDGDGLRYARPEHRHSRDFPEGGNRATARHRKPREIYLEKERPRSRDW